MTERVSRLPSISDALQTSLDTSQDLTRGASFAGDCEEMRGHGQRAADTFWRTLHRSNAVTKLADELAKLQGDMDTYMLISLHSSARRFIRDQKSAFESLGNDLKHLVSQLASGVDKLSDLTKYESERTQAHVSREYAITRNMLAEELRKLQASIDSHHTTERKKAFVESLCFPEVKLREQQIATPYGNTCEWIFGPDGNTRGSNFIDWLTSQELNFWISGKPGSGKSITMSYICSDHRTKDYLSQGSPRMRNVPLIITFFFWNAGSPLQKSAEGLLQSVVYQILEAEPGLYDHLVAHDPQLQTRSSTLAWSMRELQSVLETVLGGLSRPLAVFIDGLDEFDGGEEYLLELIAVFQRHLVKLCLSSRPSPRLLRRFGQGPMLRTEDLNRDSINKFDHERLSNDPDLRKLLIERPEEKAEAGITSLVSAITNKAQGVFLWAKLAVDSIREGLENLDRFETLMKRLDLLSSELDDMYEQIWERINRSPYAEEVKLVFVATLHCEEPLPILYLLVDQYTRTGKVPIGVDAADIASSDLPTLQMRLLSQCRGLVEVATRDLPDALSRWQHASQHHQPSINHEHLLKFLKVKFMHQSARDFALRKLSVTLRDWNQNHAEAWANLRQRLPDRTSRHGPLDDLQETGIDFSHVLDVGLGNNATLMLRGWSCVAGMMFPVRPTNNIFLDSDIIHPPSGSMSNAPRAALSLWPPTHVDEDDWNLIEAKLQQVYMPRPPRSLK